MIPVPWAPGSGHRTSPASRRLTLALAVIFALGAALALAPARAATDVPGSRDPEGLERFPDSQIVAYTPSAETRNYEFITGRVDRISRAVRVDDSVRVAAQLTRVSYRAPDRARLADVVDHYQRLIRARKARVAFTCHGRDCGRSTIWANDVFGVKELVAPDSAQFYLAAAMGADANPEQSVLTSIYVVQRGNRRIYAHVDVARTRAPTAVEPNRGITAELLRRGFAVLTDAAPDASGAVDGAGLAALDGVARELTALAGRAVYVVCHLGGFDNPENSMTRSQTCAETAATRLRAGGVNATGFGAGVLMPREGAPAERLELVISPLTRRAE